MRCALASRMIQEIGVVHAEHQSVSRSYLRIRLSGMRISFSMIYRSRLNDLGLLLIPYQYLGLQSVREVFSESLYLRGTSLSSLSDFWVLPIAESRTMCS